MGSSSNINLNLEPSVEQSNPELPADQQSKNPQGGDVMEVISRIYSDNRKITNMVAEIFHNYSSLHSQLMQYLITNNDSSNPQIRKRKLTSIDVDDDDDDDNNKSCTKRMSCCSCSNEKRLKVMNSKPKVSTVFIRVDPFDSSLVVKDGYQWRKYGQKVTRDNPSPRAYFKCSFAPICPVKKKVQKSAEDPTVLVVTYEGEHNHKKASSHGSILTPSTNSSLINLSPSSYHHISSPDHLIHQNLSDGDPKHKWSDAENVDDQEQHWLVERMALSLTKDPSFTSTLASIISDKVLEQTFC